jgi:single-strand DNA-binding protein
VKPDENEVWQMNIVVVAGRLSSTPVLRLLPSGDEVLNLEVTVPGDDGPAESVPVAWPSPPSWAGDLDTGNPLVVLGRVRRRFFRAGGNTQSRTEVVARQVVPAGRRRQVAGVLNKAAAALTEGE